MTRRFHRVLGAACAALLPAAATAHPTTRPDVRALVRCQRAIGSEGLAYASSLERRLLRCVRPLRECGLTGGSKDQAACRQAAESCGGLAADLDSSGDRFHGRIVGSCAAVPLDQLMRDGGFHAELGDCPVDSPDAFADCLAGEVRAAALGRLVSRLEPATCRLLDDSRLVTSLPAEICAETGGPPTPPAADGPLYCGGPAAVLCPSGFACDRTDPLCTLADVGGMCVEVATCSDDGTPVCGCDGQTYASDCARLAAGVTRSRPGACDPAPAACLSNDQCPAGQFCDFPPRDCGEGQPGTCRPARSEPCNLCTAFVAGPVCGCDFVTYASDCERAGAGVSKLTDGPCS